MGVVFGKISEELPRHVVLYNASTFVVRRYEPAVAAVTNYASAWGESSDGRPFGSLARYIGVFSKPENAPAVPIAMTAPVIIDPAADRPHEMMFLLPASKFNNVESAPQPSNPKVRLTMLPERQLAVRVFSGNMRAARAKAERDLLLADLKADGRWEAQDETQWQAAGYNAPFVLPWFKTNEVMVPVRECATPS